MMNKKQYKKKSTPRYNGQWMKWMKGLHPENKQQKEQEQQQQLINKQPRKKIKLDQNPFGSLQSQSGQILSNTEKQYPNKIKKLTVYIDQYKTLKYLNHRSIQNCLRNLITKSNNNVQWLKINQSSQIKTIVYIDMQIEDTLFNSLIKHSQSDQNHWMNFISSKLHQNNKAQFRKSAMIVSHLWETIFDYNDENIKQQAMLAQLPIQVQNALATQYTQQLYSKYTSYTLTPQQMSNNLYPINTKLPVYSDYLQLQKYVQENNQKNRIISIDCEMVTTQIGLQLARATIINFDNEIIFDEFFKPQNPIINYNTRYSGITEQILNSVTNNIKEHLHPKLKQIITEKTIIVGHSLQNDFHAMKFIHKNVIDSSILFRRKNGTKIKLQYLTQRILKRKIQAQTHDSLEDCKASLELVKVKIHNDNNNSKTSNQYHLLKDIQDKKNVFIVDYDIDKLRKFNKIQFEKTQQDSSPKIILDIISNNFNLINQQSPKLQKQQPQNQQNKYSQPQFVFTRIKRTKQCEWEQYYKQFSEGFKNLYQKLQVNKSIIFINCQINEHYRIIMDSQRVQRPYCLVFARN